jgi:hypothetical protein
VVLWVGHLYAEVLTFFRGKQSLLTKVIERVFGSVPRGGQEACVIANRSSMSRN